MGVNGPYSILLGADAYTELAETSDYGYPVLEHVKRLVDGQLIWAPAIDGAFVITTRGGDFDFQLGQDISIGYLSHNDTHVRLYLQETFTFLYLTAESAVAFDPPSKPPSWPWTMRAVNDHRRDIRLLDSFPGDEAVHNPTLIPSVEVREVAGVPGFTESRFAQIPVWPNFTETARRSCHRSAIDGRPQNQ